MIALIAAAGALLALLLSLPRLIFGPTLHDRALAARTLVIRVALMAAAGAVLFADARLADVAFVLVFSALVMAFAALKTFRLRTFQAPLARSGES